MLIAFQQWQQRQVDTWLPLAQRLEATYSALRYYELPTIRRLNTLARTFINEGMRAGIPDPVARERTITLYVDKRAFREMLGLCSEENYPCPAPGPPGTGAMAGRGRLDGGKGRGTDRGGRTGAGGGGRTVAGWRERGGRQ